MERVLLPSLARSQYCFSYLRTVGSVKEFVIGSTLPSASTGDTSPDPLVLASPLRLLDNGFAHDLGPGIGVIGKRVIKGVGLSVEGFYLTPLSSLFPLSPFPTLPLFFAPLL